MAARFAVPWTADLLHYLEPLRLLTVLEQYPVEWDVVITEPCAFEVEMQGFSPHIVWGDGKVLDYEREIFLREDPNGTEEPPSTGEMTLVVRHHYHKAGTYRVKIYGEFQDIWVPHDAPNWTKTQLAKCVDNGTVPMLRETFLKQHWPTTV